MPRGRGSRGIKGDLVGRFVRAHLRPRLCEGDLVAWGNQSVHKRPELLALIWSRGADLALQPRYSPEFNASEEMWSKVEHLVRRARADTVGALADALALAGAR